MKRETRMNLLILLLVALGLGVMFFPSISDWYYRWQTSREIAQYNQVAEAAPEDYSQLWEAAEAYNRRLAEGGLFSAGGDPGGTSGGGAAPEPPGHGHDGVCGHSQDRRPPPYLPGH